MIEFPSTHTHTHALTVCYQRGRILFSQTLLLAFDVILLPLWWFRDGKCRAQSEVDETTRKLQQAKEKDFPLFPSLCPFLFSLHYFDNHSLSLSRVKKGSKHKMVFPSGKKKIKRKKSFRWHKKIALTLAVVCWTSERVTLRELLFSGSHCCTKPLIARA